MNMRKATMSSDFLKSYAQLRQDAAADRGLISREIFSPNSDGVQTTARYFFERLLEFRQPA